VCLPLLAPPTPPLHYTTPQDQLRDKLGVLSTKASLLLQLGRPAEAEVLYRQLLERNPDDYSVHEGLHRCIGIHPPQHTHSWQQQHQQQQQGAGSSSSSSSSSSSGGVWSAHSGKKRRVLQSYSGSEVQSLVGLYRELCEAYPKSLACHRMPLDFLVRTPWGEGGGVRGDTDFAWRGGGVGQERGQGGRGRWCGASKWGGC